MISKVTSNFIILRKVTDKHGKHPIRLVIYDGKSRKRYATGISLSNDDWEKLYSKNLRNDDLKTVRSALEGIRTKADEVIAKLSPFSITAFEIDFFGLPKPEEQPKQIPSIKELFVKYITKLKSNGQAGTAISYQTTINSMENFKPGLLVTQITTEYLDEYEQHLANANKSNSTIGIYMRQLRAIMNQAIKAKHLHSDDYPFQGYTIPAARNLKKALSEADIARLLTHQTDDASLRKALDFWIFSYLCNGMNFADIAHLKPENIDGNILFFTRQKTRRTKKKDLTPIRVGLNPRALKIIAKYRNTSETNPYLFPILDSGLNPLQAKYRIQHFIKWVNKHMETIRISLDIKVSLATYSARHSFSTLLKRKGISTAFIKEALGHSSEATTESYLASFSDDVKLEYANILTNFADKPS